jgi:transposase
MSDRTTGKYTAPRITRFIKAIRKGVSIRAACKAAGIETCTYYGWRKKYPEFARDVDAASLKGEENLVKTIQEASVDDWRAAKFLLERRYKAWGAQPVTSAENKELMDRLKIMESALSVKLNALRIQQVTQGKEDFDILDILNEVHGIEEKMDGQGLKSAGTSSEGSRELPEKEEEPQKEVLH